MHKRIGDGAGATHLGPLRLPFRVVETRGGPELAYRGPLGVVRDRLTPSGDGGWDGVTLVLGVPVGRFRMTRPRGAGPGP